MAETTEKFLTRDCEAVQIPNGNTVTLEKGARVFLTQTLGGSFTVMCDFGLARVDGADADALDLELIDTEPAAVAPPSGEAGATPDEAQLWAQLRNVYDPEIPVNIVDLGLVYSLEVQPLDEGNFVRVQMTLTAPGCGMGPAIAADAQGKLMQVSGVDGADVDLIWDPPWNQSMISEEGRMILGLV